MNSNKFIKECIVKSLVSMMKEKEFKDISITEITKKAGVSRMAYYRNYNFKEDILNDYMTTLIEDYKSKREENKDNPYLLILNAFEFFKNNKDFVLALEKSNLSNVIQNKINDYMVIFYPKALTNIEARYKLYILSGALYNTCKMWLINGLKEDSKLLAKAFVEILFPNESSSYID